MLFGKFLPKLVLRISKRFLVKIIKLLLQFFFKTLFVLCSFKITDVE